MEAAGYPARTLARIREIAAVMPSPGESLPGTNRAFSDGSAGFPCGQRHNGIVLYEEAFVKCDKGGLHAIKSPSLQCLNRL